MLNLAVQSRRHAWDAHWRPESRAVTRRRRSEVRQRSGQARPSRLGGRKTLVRFNCCWVTPSWQACPVSDSLEVT